MWQTNQSNGAHQINAQFKEFLVLDLLAKNATNYQYIVSFQKTLFEATIPLISLRSFGRNGLQFGTVLNGSFSIDSSSKKIHVKSVQRIYMLTKATNNKWAQLKLEFNDRLKKNVIACSALTSGCFTYLEKEYWTPAVYNDVLGIIVDSEEEPQLPKRQIGRLVCTVIAVKCSSDDSWKFRIENIKKFEKVLSIAMEANVSDNEHFGLVTREESMTLIGKCMAFQMKRCHGMNPAVLTPIETTTSPSPIALPPASVSTSPSSSTSTTPEGRHVDFGSMREDVVQLEVNVQSGFVEVVTIAEYSGYTDHDGLPLLWSHDVEFVVDISNMFHDYNLSFGLYKIKVVRFHRNNVFAKWRLARKDPILMAMQTRFHSQCAHSINLASIDHYKAVTEDSISEVEVVEEEPRRRLQSFSRFGNSAQSCCLPRTDSLDKVELFDALIRNETASASVSISSLTITTTPTTAPLGASRRLNHGRSLSVSNRVTEIDDDLLWTHHATSVLKIVDDDEEAMVNSKIPDEKYPEEEHVPDENSNVF
ncbi:hypothetical protein CAEBREN_25910 [Caenorhabditis brenneri]|uniref:Uncharacterized protein n=1 Tax=Caenorhabditis brenneri TaxID=135651 RepID=G0PF53_CAEBE|nr:hypothetical protein CAEBREN_25910 [Caenorhabditis brenneri]